MKKLILATSLLSVLCFGTSCDSEVLDDLTQVNQSGNIADGLKEALKVGTDSAVSKLNVEGGYFRDAAVKILLPDQVGNAITALKEKSISFANPLSTAIFPLPDIELTGEDIYTQGFSNDLLGINIEPLNSKEEEIILGINQAAEKAAADAKPIFVDAITGITIADAENILFGGVDSAATSYLNNATRPLLTDKFEPKIDAALTSVTIRNVPVATQYENFVADYNNILNTSLGIGTIGSLMDINTIGVTDLSEHATEKGLDGLFLKVADQEKQIRENPLARVTDLLKDVFGKLD